MVETIATAAGTIIALLALLWAIVRFIYKRGRDEQSIANSIDKQAEATNRNTSATNELAAQVGGLRVTLESHSQVLTEHHFRLKALEEKEREVRVTVK